MTAFDVAYVDLFKVKFRILPEKNYMKKLLTIRSHETEIKSELRIID